MLVDGIIGGVGAVIVFLPQILILYAFISFMEDSGYMARAAFIMDKLMHKMGLHGKSFIPHREQTKQTDNDAYPSVHELFGKTANLHHDNKHLLRT